MIHTFHPQDAKKKKLKLHNFAMYMSCVSMDDVVVIEVFTDGSHDSSCIIVLEATSRRGESVIRSLGRDKR